MCHYARYLVHLFILFLLLRTGASGRKKKKSTDKNIRQPEINNPTKQEYKVRLNGSICLPCELKIQYESPMNILQYWSKDNMTITPAWQYFEQKQDCLLIKNIKSYDHGSYKCIAINTFGSTSAERVLNVIDRLPVNSVRPRVPPGVPVDVPEFLKDNIRVVIPLQRKSVAVGKKMRLKCKLEGEPSPTIRWLYNGNLVIKDRKYLLRQNNKLLVIKKFSEYDAGNYTCLGSNLAGQVQMTHLIAIKPKPTTVPTTPSVSPTKLRVKEGQNATLTCIVSAADVQYLVWKTPTVHQPRGSKIQRGFRRGGSGNIGQDANARSQRYFSKREFIRGGQRIQESILLNVTKDIHEGVYKCMALFKLQTRVVTVKVIQVIVESDTPIGPNSLGGDEEFPLNIVLPAACVAFFLLLIFLGICFAFRKKARQAKGLLIPIAAPPTQTFEDQEDDSANMQILPMYNYDSLKKNTNKSNRSSSHRSSTNSQHTADNSDLTVHSSRETNIDESTHNISLENRSTSSKLSIEDNLVQQPVTGQVNNNPLNKKNSILELLPSREEGVHIEQEYTTFEENERLLVECPTEVRNKTQSKDSLHDTLKDEKIPLTIDCEEPGVQRRLKNWEPLINRTTNANDTRIGEETMRSP